MFKLGGIYFIPPPLMGLKKRINKLAKNFYKTVYNLPNQIVAELPDCEIIPIRPDTSTEFSAKLLFWAENENEIEFSVYEDVTVLISKINIECQRGRVNHYEEYIVEVAVTHARHPGANKNRLQENADLKEISLLTSK